MTRYESYSRRECSVPKPVSPAIYINYPLIHFALYICEPTPERGLSVVKRWCVFFCDGSSVWLFGGGLCLLELYMWSFLGLGTQTHIHSHHRVHIQPSSDTTTELVCYKYTSGDFRGEGLREWPLGRVPGYWFIWQSLIYRFTMHSRKYISSTMQTARCVTVLWCVVCVGFCVRNVSRQIYIYICLLESELFVRNLIIIPHTIFPNHNAIILDRYNRNSTIFLIWKGRRVVHSL